MKHREAVGIIETRFIKINVTLNRLIANFATEDIHQFRIEVKKLRAFLRSIKTELKLPKRLRKFYDTIGIVRNLQLQQQRIAKVVTETGDSLPSKYLSTINVEAITNIKKAKKIIKKRKTFKKEEKSIINIFTKKIERPTIKKFFNSEADLLNKQLLLNQPGDETLHSIRKILKDILYTQPYISKKTRTTLLPWLSEQANVKLITELLGGFQDARTILNYLRPHYTDEIPECELLLLKSIEKKWQREKENIKQQVYRQLNKNSLAPQQLKQHNRKRIYN